MSRQVKRDDGHPYYNAHAARGKHRPAFVFRRDHLPDPALYYQRQGLKVVGRGEWKSARCPFHDDRTPSLRVRLDTGAFRCMACGAHGGDVLAFHLRRHRLRFIEGAQALGAWKELR